MKFLSLLLLGLLLCQPIVLAQSKLKEERGKSSAVSAVEALVTFDNQSSHAVKIYWINFSGDRVLYKTLSPSEKYTQSTFLTHPWVVTDSEDNGLKFHEPTSEPSSVVITDEDFKPKGQAAD